jgi:hypothetical protein
MIFHQSVFIVARFRRYGYPPVDLLKHSLCHPGSHPSPRKTVNLQDRRSHSFKIVVEFPLAANLDTNSDNALHIQPLAWMTASNYHFRDRRFKLSLSVMPWHSINAERHEMI